MLRLIGLVVAIGFADSVNPTRIPPLYLAVGRARLRPPRRVHRGRVRRLPARRGRDRARSRSACALRSPASSARGGTHSRDRGGGSDGRGCECSVAATRPRNGAARARGRLQAHLPAILAGLALLAGVFVVLLGVTGLTAHRRLGTVTGVACPSGSSAEAGRRRTRLRGERVRKCGRCRSRRSRRPGCSFRPQSTPADRATLALIVGKSVSCRPAPIVAGSTAPPARTGASAHG